MDREKSIIRLILNIYRTSQAHIAPGIAEYHVGRGQWYLLNRLLFEGDGISQEELSREMVVDKAHTARAIRILEEKELLYREKDPSDGRKNKIFISEKAKEIRDDYHSIYKELNKVLVKNFSQEEIKLLMSFLYRMDNNIKSHMETSD